ncbi:hypothetical protein A51_022891 [Vibrio cholerae MZO-3]|nr:hypothetical protein A51_022891 [Vibrio cholerae MZO-3]
MSNHSAQSIHYRKIVSVFIEPKRKASKKLLIEEFDHGSD